MLNQYLEIITDHVFTADINLHFADKILSELISINAK